MNTPSVDLTRKCASRTGRGLGPWGSGLLDPSVSIVRPRSCGFSSKHPEHLMWRRILTILVARNREFYRDRAGLSW
ncbi:MAG: hypothetical protein EOM22_17845, partial [Gammaproteobacteria bacterium]|nr:hypothetical protein [Gammaproteobacteria bacterium]